MKRKLTTQMLNEWRGNIWLIIEIAVVAGVVWTVYMLLISLASAQMIHYGYKLENLYHAAIMEVPQEADGYMAYTDSLHNYITDREALVAKIRQNPYVKEVGLGSNAMPYNYNYRGYSISVADDDSLPDYLGNMREVSPEIIRMIHLEGLHGETSEQLAAMIERGNILISNSGDSEINPELYIGKEMYLTGNEEELYHIGAAAYGLRRNDYEGLWNGVIYFPLGKGSRAEEMVIEIYPGKDKEFLESLRADDMEAGNVFLLDLKSIDTMRRIAHRDIDIQLRDFSVIGIFMLIIVFLGFLGTFWFRISHRTSEIAIRMVNGATRRSIFTRLITEGYILLLIGVMLSAVLIIILDKTEVLQFASSNSWIEIMITVAATIVSLALIITAGILMPARKAMNINPAEALNSL